MGTTTAIVWLWLEASAIAILYPLLALGRGRGPGRALLLLAAVLAGHAALAALAWRLADGAGDGRAQVAIRVSFAALAFASWGLGVALARTRLDPGLAAAIAVVLGLVVVWGPAPGQTLAQASGAPVRYRSLGFAVSSPHAASVALGLDMIHAPAFYGRIPAVQLETHMTTWTRTTGGFALAGSLFSLLGLAGRRRNRAALITAMALAVGAVGCKGKDGEAKQAPPAPAPAPAPATIPTPTPTPAPLAVNKNPTVTDIDLAINRGIDALVKARGADGQIGGHPGTTSLAAMAMSSAGVGKDDPRLKPSLGVLATLAKPDGSIYEKEYPVYVTAMSSLALQQSGAYPELVAKAQRWLADKQFAENNKVDPKNTNYGGIGYGVDVTEPKADLSNLEVALDALKDSQLADKALVMQRAQRFIERCQNRTESNDQKWASNDGGFVYEPGSSKAGGTASSGSMTYTGLASYLYTAADAKDSRVVAAIEWVKGHYSVDENPGLGQKGLYFHFHMMGRALGLLGQRTFADSDGRNHDWPVELAAKVMSLQKPDGTWVNPDGTYWESNPVMATSRSVLALAHARAAMK